MLRNQQNLNQKQQQSLQQKLSPQQLQYIKLLQLPTIGLEQRIKEEIEANPVLEEVDPGEYETVSLSEVEEEPKEEEKSNTGQTHFGFMYQIDAFCLSLEPAVEYSI